jgi:hypothetical protein
MFTKPLLRNGLHNPGVLLLHTCILQALHRDGCCLQGHCLAVGLYAMIYCWYICKSKFLIFQALWFILFSCNDVHHLL